MHADPDFLAFVESLSAQPEALPGADAAGSSGQKDGQSSGPQVTALMAYLQEKHSLKKRPPAVMVRSIFHTENSGLLRWHAICTCVQMQYNRTQAHFMLESFAPSLVGLCAALWRNLGFLDWLPELRCA